MVNITIPGLRLNDVHVRAIITIADTHAQHLCTMSLNFAHDIVMLCYLRDSAQLT